MSNKAKIPATLQRWLELLAYGLLAAVAVWLFLPAALVYLSQKAEGLRVGPWANYGIAVLVGFGLAHAASGRPGAFWGTRHFRRYPPLWMALPFGFGGLCLGWLASPRAWRAVELSVTHDLITITDSLVPLILLLGVALAIPVGAARLTKRPEAVPPPSPNHALLGMMDFPSLRGWLDNDNPIDHPDQDLFKRKEIAERIAERLSGSGFNERSSVAVIGELGSGKTTIQRLVAAQLKGPKMVSVSLWPYETSDAAVRGVLRKLIDSLAEEVNVLGLTGLSEAYRRAIGGIGGVFSTLGDFFGATHDPESILETIDRIAGAAQLRFVVWVEDLERFSPSYSSDGGEDRIAPVRALLHLIDDLDNVSVVLASTTLEVRFDVEKIARYVEHVPALDVVLTRSLLHTFREGCLHKTGAFIDPVASREDVDFAPIDEGFYRAVFVGHRKPEWGQALTALAATPRRLKQGLRRCLEAWKSLRGEIDFDNLLVMSVLREAEPDLIVLIDRHIDELRYGDRSRKMAGSPGPSVFQQDFDAWISPQGGRLKAERVASIRKVVDHVFGLPERRGPTADRPQGLAVHAHVDYWQRFQSPPVRPPEKGDQFVLRAIDERRLEVLVDLISNDQDHAAVEHFGSRLDEDALCHLLERIVDARSKESAKKWQEKKWQEWEPPGITPLRRLLMQQPTEMPEQRAILVRECLGVAVSTNLVLMERLAHWLIDSKENIFSAFDESEKLVAALWGHARRLLCGEYLGKPDRLAERLSEGPPWLLLRLLWGDASKCGEVPFPRWEEMAQTILDAAESHPAVMLPQLANILVRPDLERRHADWRYSESLDAQLFGGAAIEWIRRSVDTVDGGEAYKAALPVKQNASEPREP